MSSGDVDNGQHPAITGTRLDRLFALLEVGSNALTRKTAAQQIGEVQKYHPHELQNLLFRLRKYLHQKNWDTRTAAGQAIEYICQNVKPFSPNWDADAASALESESFRVALRFSDFNLHEIIERGLHLLSSGGNEYEMDINLSSMDPKARIEIQKKRLLKRLGFDKKIDCGIEHIFKDEDFEMQNLSKAKDSNKSAASSVVSSMEKLSSREKNRLKRLEKKQSKKGWSSSKAGDSSTSANVYTPQTIVSESVMDPSLADHLQTEWPFMAFAEQLLHDLFDPVWEVRHGAGVGLRTIFQSHGRHSGMSVATASDYESLELQHGEWVDDCAIRLFCVLALDKFSDYSSGQAVCPVRETCSQALGVLMQHSPNESVFAVVENLLTLSARDEWELRHSGFLGLKYVFAVRKDLVEQFVAKLVPALIRGLQDQSDDVRAIVSDSIQPIVGIIIENSPDCISNLLSTLWSALCDYDDLSAATSSVLQAVSLFYSFPKVFSISLDLPLSDYIPRIWPCLTHSSVSVRCTALNTLQKIITLSADDRSWLTPSLLIDWLRTQFQALLFEEDLAAVEQSLQLWDILIDLVHKHHPATLMPTSSQPLIDAMIALSIAGPNETLDARFLLETSKDIDNIEEEHSTSKRRKVSSTMSSKPIDSPRGSTAMLLRGARALGITAPYLSPDSLGQFVRLLAEPRAYTRICACIIWSDSKLTNGIPLLTENLGPLPQAGREFAEFKFHRDRLVALVSDICRILNRPVPSPVTVESAIGLLTQDVTAAQPAVSQAILATKARLENECRSLVSIINACAACALLSCQDSIPEKLNPIIKPLLKSVEKQRQPELQERSAKALGILVYRCVGRPGSANNKLLQKLVGTATLMRDEPTSEDREIELRGTRRAIQAICDTCGTELFSALPVVYEMASCTMKRFRDNSAADTWTSETNQASLFLEMQFLSLLLHYANCELIRSKIPELLPLVCHCLSHPSSSIRDQAAVTLTDFCNVDLVSSFEYVISNIVPVLSQTKNDIARSGAATALHKCLSELGVVIVPYLSFIVAPLLARMTDPLPEIREIASLGFAAAVRLMPLESGVPDPENMNPELAAKRAENRAFITQLLDGAQIPDYTVSVKIKAELRRYQQEGVNWLAFLQKSNLHGILCDDMGLGKTLQTMCIVASCVAERRQAGAETLPTLVLCPSTLVHHWVFEIEKFCDPADLTGFAYDGTATIRNSLRQHIFKSVHDNVVVMSYNVWRSDLQYLQMIRWNYCILDEGHVIKNPKSRLTEAVKLIRANHRLVLSGTPVQNVVTDLWSIFDFLMPGYLGSYQYFNSKYAKPISLGNSAKASEKEQEGSIKALENLHKQVLPFLLRRIKEDVLNDLPEKIIQDYYCDLSQLQLELYDSFSRSPAVQEVQTDMSYDAMKDSNQNDGAKHVFQVLQYLRKLITHPLLVLDKAHPDYERVTSQLKQNNQSLHDLEFSPKLLALQQLLIDLNIGTQDDVNPITQHRALIFAQFKSVLDIIQEDLFKRHMPTVTFLRMDGSLSPAERFEVVKKFNGDPTIDVLLLTTHIGGLGLNLTGADTVIFVEHDWNPSKDLQAMDRAHRIGQTKVVNVYRLIARNTLEEKVMALQKWKQSVANTVITQDNSSLRSMDTDQILDLMTVSTDKSKAAPASTKANTEVDALGNVVTAAPGKTGMKAMLDGLQEMWDESQYQEEYNLEQFMKRLQ